MRKVGKAYIGVEEICELTGYSVGRGAGIIQELNRELAKAGFMVIPGQVPRTVFMSRFGLTPEAVDNTIKSVIRKQKAAEKGDKKK